MHRSERQYVGGVKEGVQLLFGVGKLHLNICMQRTGNRILGRDRVTLEPTLLVNMYMLGFKKM